MKLQESKKFYQIHALEEELAFCVLWREQQLEHHPKYYQALEKLNKSRIAVFYRAQKLDPPEALGFSNRNMLITSEKLKKTIAIGQRKLKNKKKEN